MKITPTNQITYFNCNKDILISFGLIVPSVIFTSIVLILFVYSGVRNKFRTCEPLYFFLGNKTGCNNFIAETANRKIAYLIDKQKQKQREKELEENYDRENFTTFGENVSSEFYNIENACVDFKEIATYLKIKYLAMIDQIYEFNHSILEILANLFNRTFAFFKEKY